MDEVASAAGVSRATVSRVLSGSNLVVGSTREKVLAAVERLGYVPNTAAQQLASRSSDVVGLLLRDPRNPAYGLLHSELQDATEGAGLQLVTVVPTKGKGETSEAAGLRRLLGLRVGGLFVASGVVPAELLEPFLPEVPLLSVGRPEAHPGIYAVSYDERSNGRQLADAVMRHGHTRVGVLETAPRVSISENLRSVSIIERLRERGATVVPVEATTFGVVSERNEVLVDLVRSRTVTALMFPSDWRMLEFAEVATTAGLRIPDDVSITGCDGIIPGIRRLGFATLRIPVEVVARRAVEVMAGMLERPEATEPHHELYPGVMLDGRSLSTPNHS